MTKSIGTSLVIRHFPDRAKPCLCIEQGNQAMILATFRNKECEDLYKEFLQGNGMIREMRPIFDQEGEETRPSKRKITFIGGGSIEFEEDPEESADERLLNSDWGDMEVQE